MALSGSTWFLTQKISWNQTNRHPHHTFWWEGLDGTRVFTHFPPVDTYNSELSGEEMAHLVRNFSEKGLANRSLVPFGHGDGGGGPTREMLARAARLRDLEGSARVEIEAPAAFFEKAQADHADPAVWVGRAVPGAAPRHLHDARPTPSRATGAASTCCARPSCGRPPRRCGRVRRTRRASWTGLWKTVLLHQFHDILPGSSIAWVHREARETYAQVARELGDLIATAQGALAGNAAADSTVVFNAAPHARGGVPAGGAVVSAPPTADQATARRRRTSPPPETGTCSRTVWCGPSSTAAAC